MHAANNLAYFQVPTVPTAPTAQTGPFWPFWKQVNPKHDDHDHVISFLSLNRNVRHYSSALDEVQRVRKLCQKARGSCTCEDLFGVERREVFESVVILIWSVCRISFNQYYKLPAQSSSHLVCITGTPVHFLR